jgi:DNA ligase-1
MPTMIQKPMLAATLIFIDNVLYQVRSNEYIPFKLSDLPFPLLCTPKIDGIRSLIIQNQALSRSFKPIANKYIRTMLQKYCPNGFDGEIIVGDTFYDTSSGVMTHEGKPKFTYLVFDWYMDEEYEYRCIRLSQIKNKPEWVSFLLPVQVDSYSQLLQYEKKMLKAGHEGIMVRTLDSPYKFGRSTLKEFYLVKIIRILESEAKVIGFEELTTNTNVQKTDELGYSKRSSSKKGMVPRNMLGALIVEDVKSGVKFNLGNGFNYEQRKEIWNNKKFYFGAICTYRYKPFGVKDKPRAPIFKGWRQDK